MPGAAASIAAWIERFGKTRCTVALAAGAVMHAAMPSAAQQARNLIVFFILLSPLSFLRVSRLAQPPPSLWIDS